MADLCLPRIGLDDSDAPEGIGFDATPAFCGADLHDVLVQRDPPQKQQTQILSGSPTDGLGYPAASTLLKEHHGRRYLLATNSSRGAVRARVNAGVEAAQVQVMLEDR